MSLVRGTTLGIGSLVVASLALAAWGAGCGDDGGAEPGAVESDAGEEDGGTGGFEGGVDAEPLPPDAKAMLEVYPLDIWAQFLPDGEFTFQATVDGQPLASSGFPVLLIPLKDAGTIRVELSAEHFEDLAVELSYNGGDQVADVVLGPNTAAEGHGVSLSQEMRTVDGRQVPAHSLFLGLRHEWFSAQGRPARRGNQIDLLIDGEEAWASAEQDLRAATDSIHISTWWWVSNFELVRDMQNHLTLSQSERYRNTILSILEQSTAHKRVSFGQLIDQDGFVAWVSADDNLKAYAEAPNDMFEVMGQANPTRGTFLFEVAPFLFGDRIRTSFPETAFSTFAMEQEVQSRVPGHVVDLTEWPVNLDIPHGSYHQKFIVIDEDISHIGGMNYQAVDWDTSAHEVFDPRRMPFDATQAERQAVLDKEELPETPPRKDYVVRVQGPATQDAAEIFQIRWDHLIDTQAAYHDRSTSFDIDRNISESPGGEQIQVTATLPQPFWEHAIAETWLNAVAKAERYIFIEDQYFRAPMLNDALVARMDEVPDLRLIVMTLPVNTLSDPGCAWTHQTHQLFKTKFPGRYMMLQLRSFDTNLDGGIIDETRGHFVDIYIHSKMFIVDDIFMSVGSCNKNNRGMIYEAELNLAVLSPQWVHQGRLRIFENLLPPGTPPTDDPAVFWDQFARAVQWNDQVYNRWEGEGFDLNLNGDPVPVNYVPNGFLYSLDPGTLSDCFIESVGPDMTELPTD